jgi:hypothetical protein
VAAASAAVATPCWRAGQSRLAVPDEEAAYLAQGSEDAGLSVIAMREDHVTKGPLHDAKPLSPIGFTLVRGSLVSMA